MRNEYNILGGQSVEKRPKTRERWLWEGWLNSSGSEQNPVTGSYEHGNEISGSAGNFVTNWSAMSFSKTLPNGVQLVIVN
jgi:hypothetical protein